MLIFRSVSEFNILIFQGVVGQLDLNGERVSSHDMIPEVKGLRELKEVQFLSGRLDSLKVGGCVGVRVGG